MNVGIVDAALVISTVDRLCAAVRSVRRELPTSPALAALEEAALDAAVLLGELVLEKSKQS